MSRIIPAEPHWLRAGLAKGKAHGVDRDSGAGVIRGYIVAERGPFKSAGRGEFNDAGLRGIVQLMNARPAGTKSRFTHASVSDDGLGKFLGRARNARLDGGAVRADLHLSPASRKSPSGDLGGYVMDLAENDPAAFGSSLVLQVRQEEQLDSEGKPLTDARGEPLPPLWYPTAIHGSDVVDDGDAVHSGFLSADAIDLDNLPDAVQRQGWEMLDRLFSGQPRDAVLARCRAYLDRYLAERFGGAPPPAPTPRLDALRNRLDRMELTARELRR